MRKGMLLGTIGCLSLLALAMVADDAQAIPAFARKYKTACITCHATFPRLTALGEAFRLNGYRMPGGDELYVKDQPMSLGAEAYKQVFPNAVWPSDIPGMPPLAIRVVTDYAWNVGGGGAPRTEFSIDEVTLLSGGSLGQNMAFFTGLEHHDPVTSGEFVTETGTEFFAWLMWSSLFKKTLGENHLNARFGTVGKQDLGLPNTRNEGKITVQDYLYAEEEKGLNIDAGGPKSVGVELNGFGKNWRWNAGVMNGESGGNHKDHFALASFKFGGLGYDGSGGTTEEGGLKTPPTGYWRDDSIRFGVFYFKSYSETEEFKFDRIGADVRWNYKDLSVAAGYIAGNNHATEADPDIGRSEKRRVWFAEAEYFVFPWMQPYFRHEHLTSNLPDQAVSRVVLGTVLLARANVKFNVEGVVFTKNEPIVVAGGDKHDEDRVVVQLDYAY